MNQIFENMIDGVHVVSEDYEVEFMNKILLDEFGDQVGSISKLTIFREKS